MSKEVYLNGEIRANEVRCVGDNGEDYGIISKQEALRLANEQGVDLVLVAPNAKPVVCKLMDYGKFRYQQEKKAKEAKKKQKVIEVKEIKFSAKTAQNDLNYKIKHAQEFIEAGKHVKFRVFLKGREMANPEVGVQMLDRVWEVAKEFCDRDKAPNLEGRYVNMLVFPKKG